MARTFEQILAEFAALKPTDFDDEAEGILKLQGLTNELMTLPQPECAIPAIFDVMERLSGADLGSPGPLVHTLERMRGHYETDLTESIKRKPTALTVWMLNRMLNGTLAREQRQIYLDLLRLAAKHPAASSIAKGEAARFFKRHTREAAMRAATSDATREAERFTQRHTRET